MKFFSTCAAVALACSSAFAHPLHDPEGVETLEKRQQTNVPLAGGKTGAVRPRLEIRNMQSTQPNQYTLLVLAMESWMQSTSQSSYYAISGIHGVPRVNYNNKGQCRSCGGTDGYCTHDSVHFPAWHRAYVALFEQEFLKVALSIANSYPTAQRQTMVNAAQAMRFPFWDWAARPGSGNTLPTAISEGYITVNGPTGSRRIVNPLYRYTFRNGQQRQNVYGPFTTWTNTYRYPTSNSASAGSNTQAAINAFDNIRQSMQDQVYDMMTNCQQYLYFSNDASDSATANCANSLEGIHNTIHNAAGGPDNNGVSGGHMTYLSTGAFDPIFWLHHCNVDRLFALWQTLWPNSYGASQVAPHSTWTIAQGSSQNANSPLDPFIKPDGSSWNTNDVRNFRVFGYSYPEFFNSDGSRASIASAVNRLYGPNASGTTKREAEAAPQGLIGGVLKGVGDILANNPLAARNGSLYQYTANIQTPRYALNGSYNVFVFNGKPASDDTSTWITSSNLIGMMGVLAQPGMNNMNKDLIASGSIPLTRALTAHVHGGLLGSLAELVVAPFLSKNLKWRIAQNGKSIDTSTVDGFVVTVLTSSAPPLTKADELPKYSPYIELLDITKGQAGGANTTQYQTTYQ